MPISQTQDLTKNNFAFQRTIQGFRPVAASLYPLGTLVKLASQDLQVWPDGQTVIPTATAANQQNIQGVVSDSWAGFNPAAAAISTTAPSATARGSFGVDVVTGGYHPAILVDNSGTGNATITNESTLIPSRASAGQCQGGTAVAGLGTAAIACLPASGIGSSITGGSLVQASQTLTVAGTPTVGDVYTTTIQVPYTAANPGTVQTLAIATGPLSAAQATSATTAAAAVVLALNGNSTFAKYFIATNSSGVVTVKVIATAAPFLVTFGSTLAGLTNSITLSLSGAVGNSITLTAAATGVGTFTAGGATLASGAGYLGTLPGWVI